MPTNEQGSTTSSQGWAGSLGGAQCAVAAVTTIAVAYGAYKVIGGWFASGSEGPLFNPLELQHWKNLGPDRELIHVVQARYLHSSPLYKENAAEVLKSWDIISASLVDASLIKTTAAAERYTGLGGAVGFMFEVAPQNILGTHPHDISFTEGVKGWDVVDDCLKRSPNNPHFKRLMSPDDLLNRRNSGHLWTTFWGGDYNEVLVFARAGVKTYDGYPATEHLKLKGVVIIPGAGTGVATTEQVTAAHKLKDLNRNLPVYAVEKGRFVVRIP